MDMKRAAVVVFSKSADWGKVKTRLQSVLSLDRCLSLHVALLQDTLEKCKQTSATAVLYLAGSGLLPFPHEFRTESQTGVDLGDRMANAFDRELHHFDSVTIIGTDSPTFPPSALDEAQHALDSHDVVLGPAEDGGYYLIALKERIPGMFQGMEWGTSTVLESTMKRLAGKSVYLLKKSFDVDTPEDLQRLEKVVETSDLPYLQHTRDWFRGR